MVFFADYPFFEKLFSNLSIIVPMKGRLRFGVLFQGPLGFSKLAIVADLAAFSGKAEVEGSC